MVQIKINRGLDIPIKGKPEGSLRPLITSGDALPLAAPPLIALNLSGFDEIKFRLLVKPGEVVKIGQALAEDKESPGRMFVSPAGGVVKEMRRGPKRVLLDILIEVAGEESYQVASPLDVGRAGRQEIVNRMKESGLFAHVRQRPFNILANPAVTPRCIFVKALESAPFVPPAELQVTGHEKEFQIGLNALAKLTDGAVHLVYRADSNAKAFTEAKNVQKHTAEGPHPISNQSLHIQKIAPIKAADDKVWTLNVHDVVTIGHTLSTGRYFIDRIISIAGPGILPDRVGYFKVREGYPIDSLISGRIDKGTLRLISGDPLTGIKVSQEDFLGFQHYVFCAFKENTKREFLHFFRIGPNKFSFSKAYLSGHLKQTEREYDFTTNQHGEHRAFIDGAVYDEVQPLHIPTMLLVKALMAEDYDLADTYGLVEVDSEDFALPAFVDPSKIDMVGIVKKGLKQFCKEAR